MTDNYDTPTVNTTILLYCHIACTRNTAMMHSIIWRYLYTVPYVVIGNYQSRETIIDSQKFFSSCDIVHIIDTQSAALKCLCVYVNTSSPLNFNYINI